MRGTDFELFVSRIASLSLKQRDKLLELLQQSTRREQVIARLEAAAATRLCCPVCRSDRYHKHGRSDSLQRYRCIACGKTFNALSGTPLARLRHRAKWLDFTQSMLDSRSVRRAAADLGIHKNTSFRWRHRFLTLTRTDRPQCLHGIAEADEMYLLESEKGSRHLQRTAQARRRGKQTGHIRRAGLHRGGTRPHRPDARLFDGEGAGHGAPVARVLVARDRSRCTSGYGRPRGLPQLRPCGRDQPPGG